MSSLMVRRVPRNAAISSNKSGLSLHVHQAARKHIRCTVREIECCAVAQRKISAYSQFGNAMHKRPGSPCLWKRITGVEIARLLRGHDAAHKHIESILSDLLILALLV